MRCDFWGLRSSTCEKQFRGFAAAPRRKPLAFLATLSLDLEGYAFKSEAQPRRNRNTAIPERQSLSALGGGVAAILLFQFLPTRRRIFRTPLDTATIRRCASNNSSNARIFRHARG